MATGRGGSARLEQPMVHGCGKELWTPASYAIHAKHCDGTAPKTEGRIAERDRASAPRVADVPAKPARQKKPRKARRGKLRVSIKVRDRATKQLRRVARGVHVHRTPPVFTSDGASIGSCETCSHAVVCSLKEQLEGARLKVLADVSKSRAKDGPAPSITIACSAYAAEVE